MALVYIALGANLGDRRANLAQALRLLPPDVQVEAVSALYESPPQPPAPPPSYLNAACRATTELAPEALLTYLKGIEATMGRQDTGRWGPRPIDLDIALYDDVVYDGETLQIPHPRLAERAFVLRPLLDIDPSLAHPAMGETLAVLLDRVGEDGLVRIAEPGWQDEVNDRSRLFRRLLFSTRGYSGCCRRLEVLVVRLDGEHRPADPEGEGRQRGHRGGDRQGEGQVAALRGADQEEQHLQRCSDHEDDAGSLGAVHETCPVSIALRSSGGNRLGMVS